MVARDLISRLRNMTETAVDNHSLQTLLELIGVRSMWVQDLMLSI